MAKEFPMAEPTGVMPPDEGGKSRWVLLFSVFVFALIAIFFAVGLTLGPTSLSSVLIGKSAPEFDLPPVVGRDLGMSDKDLSGQVSLVNVWASWCTECRAEHPLLMDLSKQGIVPIHGLNYKDVLVDAGKWLDELGDPYSRTGADQDGRVAIDWGVYGVPETFVVYKKGEIVYNHIGALSASTFDTKIQPIIRNHMGRR